MSDRLHARQTRQNPSKFPLRPAQGQQRWNKRENSSIVVSERIAGFISPRLQRRGGSHLSNVSHVSACGFLQPGKEGYEDLIPS
jgi:hypothetical protein